MFRIALLVNDTAVPGAIVDLIDWIDAQPDLELAALIIHPMLAADKRARLQASFRSQGVYRTLSKFAFAALTKAETRFLSEEHRGVLQSVDVGDRCPVHLRLEPVHSKTGLVQRFSPEDVERVEQLGLDLLIRCGGGILKGAILDAARHGVLSMHHGDNRVNRGGPAGFWEVYNRQPATGFIVQRLTEELDGGVVLCRGSFVTRRYYALNQASLLQRSNLYLKRTIREIVEGREGEEEAILYADRLYRAPFLHQTVAYVFGLFRWIVGAIVQRLTRRNLDWQIAFTRAPWRQAVLWRAHVVANPPGRFLADPFPVTIGGKTYLLAEDYSYRTGRGHISALEVLDRGAKMLGPALTENFHLSFPFVFEHQGSTYMVPESSEARQIRLYRCAGGPTEWVFVGALLDDVVAVDSVIFPKNDRWWLLTTIVEGKSNLNDSELYAFHADSPLGPWQPHACNPVVANATSGRNGGLLRDGDEIYRVAQRPGFSLYGRGFSILKIVELTPSRFREELVQDVEPNFAPGVKGTHHLSAGGGVLAFDFMTLRRVKRGGDTTQPAI